MPMAFDLGSLKRQLLPDVMMRLSTRERLLHLESQARTHLTTKHMHLICAKDTVALQCWSVATGNLVIDSHTSQHCGANSSEPANRTRPKPSIASFAVARGHAQRLNRCIIRSYHLPEGPVIQGVGRSTCDSDEVSEGGMK